MTNLDPLLEKPPIFAGIPLTIDVDAELQPALLQYVKNEMEREYPSSARRRGQKLFPHALLSLNMAGDELEAELADQKEHFKVRMTLPIFDWESGYSFISCSCQRESLHMEEQRCAHMWLVQNALLTRLEEMLADRQGQAHDPDLHPLLGLFERFLDQDEDVTKAEEPDQAEATNSQRIVWFLQEDGSVEARLQSLRQQQWTLGRRLSWAQYLEKKELWQESHYRVASHLQTQVQQGRQEIQTDAMAILQTLLQEDLVFWADRPSEPVEFVAETLVLKAEKQGESLRIQPYLGRRLVEQVDEHLGLLLVIAKEEGSVYYGETDQKTATLVQQLLLTTAEVPLDQQSVVIDYMLRLSQKKLPVALDENMVIANRAAEDTIVFRLTPFANGPVKLDMLVKPMSEALYFPPANGPEKVLARQGDQAFHVQRDFFREEAQARDLIDRFSLMRFGFRPPSTWYLPGIDALLSLLERARSQPHLSIEWPKNDPSLAANYQLAAPLDQQKIVLQVGGKKDWLAVQGQIEVEGEEIDLSALIKALRDNRQYIELKDGRWSRITDALQQRLEQMQTALSEEDEQLRVDPAAMEELLLMEQAESLLIEQEADKWRQLRRNFQSLQSLNHSIPTNFQASLRPYQEDGFRWLNRLCAWGMGACLADDMGLGKTVQTLAVLLKHQALGASLVIAPTSVIANWAHEARRFAPDLSLVIYRETDRSAEDVKFQAGQLVLASYGLILRDRERLQQLDWNIVVIDEAQTIKNAKSQTAKAIQSLQWRWCLALSGTPIENHLGDLWSLFRTISPGLLGSWPHFRRAYGFPILAGDEKSRERLVKKIRPYILRRLKKDYLHELPDKIEIDLRVSLSEDERHIYEALRLDALAQIEGDDDAKEDESAEKKPAGQKRMKILGALTRMRLAICHPQLVKADWQLGSAKLEVLKNLLEPVRGSDQRVLIFSQFTGFLRLVRDFLQEQGIGPVAYLDGQTPADERASLVQRFQNEEFAVFLISLKAGGTGLNLTKANMVVHLDPWWNPAVEDQATDRAYRMGQKRQIMVYRLVTEATIEEQILQLHAEKRQLAQALLSEDGAELTRLDDEQLIDLIKTGELRR
ncbi:MAG: DEAD/DEAH box helicase [Oligoflexus sp.]